MIARFKPVMLFIAGKVRLGFQTSYCKSLPNKTENTAYCTNPLFFSNDIGPKPAAFQGEMWLLCALSGRLGLSYTMRKTLRGRKVNEDWMTWECPAELMGKVWVGPQTEVFVEGFLDGFFLGCFLHGNQQKTLGPPT